MQSSWTRLTSPASYIKLQLAYTTIYSPIDGRTGNLTVKSGNIVTPNTTILTTIIQVEPIYVTFSIPEARLDQNQTPSEVTRDPWKSTLRNPLKQSWNDLFCFSPTGCMPSTACSSRRNPYG